MFDSWSAKLRLRRIIRGWVRYRTLVLASIDEPTRRGPVLVEEAAIEEEVPAPEPTNGWEAPEEEAVLAESDGQSDGDFIYYVANPDDEIFGPMKMSEIDESIREGLIAETALICVVGADEWMNLAELRAQGAPEEVFFEERAEMEFVEERAEMEFVEEATAVEFAEERTETEFVEEPVEVPRPPGPEPLPTPVPETLRPTRSDGRETDTGFLGLQATLATQLQYLLDALPPSAHHEFREQIGEMANLLKRQTNPREKSPGEPWERSEFEEIWHRHYILLNELKGVPLAERSRRGSDAPAKTPVVPVLPARPMARRTRRRRPRRFLGSLIRFLFVCALLLVAVFAVVSEFGITRAPDGRFSVQTPTPLGTAIENSLNSLQSAAMPLVTLFAPVLEAYGRFGTLLLVGALMLSLAYWFFLRG